MNAIAADALRRSIHKWESILSGTGQDQGTKNCALCQSFIGFFCNGCPVKEKVGFIHCSGTPFTEWSMHHARAHDCKRFPLSIQPDCPECTSLARAELDFLTSLSLAPAAQGAGA